MVHTKEAFYLRYNSDYQGTSLFCSVLESGKTGTPQIPVVLPTQDEIVDREAQTVDFNSYILSHIQVNRGTPVYITHTEAEGVVFHQNFNELFIRAADMGMTFCPLGELLPDDTSTLPLGRIVHGKIPGREGWLDCQ